MWIIYEIFGNLKIIAKIFYISFFSSYWRIVKSFFFPFHEILIIYYEIWNLHMQLQLQFFILQLKDEFLSSECENDCGKYSHALQKSRLNRKYFCNHVFFAAMWNHHRQCKISRNFHVIFEVFPASGKKSFVWFFDVTANSRELNDSEFCRDFGFFHFGRDITKKSQIFDLMTKIKEGSKYICFFRIIPRIVNRLRLPSTLTTFITADVSSCVNITSKLSLTLCSVFCFR